MQRHRCQRQVVEPCRPSSTGDHRGGARPGENEASRQRHRSIEAAPSRHGGSAMNRKWLITHGLGCCSPKDGVGCGTPSKWPFNFMAYTWG